MDKNFFYLSYKTTLVSGMVLYGPEKFEKFLRVSNLPFYPFFICNNCNN